VRVPRPAIELACSCGGVQMEEAVSAASDAFKSWRETPVQQRVRVYLKYQQLIRDHTERIAAVITKENGKTLADSRGDVFRGLEVVEHVCSMGTLMMGETLENLSANVDTFTIRQPLGVAAGISPFNFPAMLPLWKFPMATAAGNTFVQKPSERVPGATMILAELAAQAGLPAGVLNVIHGAHDAVNFICDHPKIRAISFVGGNRAGEYIHERGTKSGKRVQSNMGAKNHGVVLPDADKDATLNALVGKCAPYAASFLLRPSSLLLCFAWLGAGARVVSALCAAPRPQLRSSCSRLIATLSPLCGQLWHTTNVTTRIFTHTRTVHCRDCSRCVRRRWPALHGAAGGDLRGRVQEVDPRAGGAREEAQGRAGPPARLRPGPHDLPGSQDARARHPGQGCGGRRDAVA
jgi:hypothetical protein